VNLYAGAVELELERGFVKPFQCFGDIVGR
jgi:hypothetical protein